MENLPQFITKLAIVTERKDLGEFFNFVSKHEKTEISFNQVSIYKNGELILKSYCCDEKLINQAFSTFGHKMVFLNKLDIYYRYAKNLDCAFLKNIPLIEFISN